MEDSERRKSRRHERGRRRDLKKYPPTPSHPHAENSFGIYYYITWRQIS